MHLKALINIMLFKDRFFNVVTYKDKQGAAAHSAATARNTKANPLLFAIPILLQHMGPRALCPIRKSKQ